MADTFDLQQLSGSDTDLSIILTDTGGKTTTIYAYLKTVDGTQKPIAVSLFGGVETDQASWYASTWLEEFYALQDDWLSLETGWLYLKPNANGGFWFGILSLMTGGGPAKIPFLCILV